MFKFSSGSEVVNLVVGSGLLQQPCTANSKLYKSTDRNQLLDYQISDHGNYSILAFIASPSSSTLEGGQVAADLVSSSNLKDTFPHFDFGFLLSKSNPSFSINKATVSLFESHHQKLTDLKTQLSKDIKEKKEKKKDWMLIITGHSAGGSIASLFTLWMLDSIDLSKTKRPLCITFGSPLIGDISLRDAINQYETWNSCFLHVVSNQDKTPGFFIPHKYKPFGTFLICSESGCACFEEPESILRLMKLTASHGAQIQDPDHYIQVVDDLYHRIFFRDATVLVNWVEEPFESGVKRQLKALGVEQSEENIEYLKEQERKFIYGKKPSFNSSKKLNAMKIYMAYLEFYKKWCKDEEVGYYDMYKKSELQCDIEVQVYRKKLTNYWIDSVKEVEKRPQKEGAPFRTGWLYGGTTYRRMIEPLDIADYYNDKKTNYKSQGRSEHYIKLEKWLKEAQEKKPETTSIKSKRASTSSILTEDSQFWAKLEEAKLLKKEDAQAEKEWEDFENHVWGLVKKYDLSPEVFLRDSSFMKWWGGYKKIKGSSYTSPFCDFMNNGEYKQYDIGSWAPPISTL